MCTRRIDVYQKKYGANHVTLVYPKTGELASTDKTEYRSTDGVIVRIRFVNLFDVHSNIKKLISQFQPLGEDEL